MTAVRAYFAEHVISDRDAAVALVISAALIGVKTMPDRGESATGKLISALVTLGVTIDEVEAFVGHAQTMERLAQS